jgi:hypothetical protein
LAAAHLFQSEEAIMFDIQLRYCDHGMDVIQRAGYMGLYHAFINEGTDWIEKGIIHFDDEGIRLSTETEAGMGALLDELCKKFYTLKDGLIHFSSWPVRETRMLDKRMADGLIATLLQHNCRWIKEYLVTKKLDKEGNQRYNKKKEEMIDKTVILKEFIHDDKVIKYQSLTWYEYISAGEDKLTAPYEIKSCYLPGAEDLYGPMRNGMVKTENLRTYILSTWGFVWGHLHKERRTRFNRSIPRRSCYLH